MWKLIKTSESKRLTSTSRKTPLASMETKHPHVVMMRTVGSIIQAPDVRDARVSMQPRFDKQVSAWIRSINPTPSAETVDEVSLLDCVCIRDRDPGPRADLRQTSSRACVMAFHPQYVNVCVRVCV